MREIALDLKEIYEAEVASKEKLQLMEQELTEAGEIVETLIF